jgi:hypothetical protein
MIIYFPIVHDGMISKNKERLLSVTKYGLLPQNISGRGAITAMAM